MNIEERRKIAIDLYKDLKDFESFLIESPVVCKALAEWLKDFLNEYDLENLNLLNSVCKGKNLEIEIFVKKLDIENIIYLNENTYILYAKCRDFDFGTSVQLTLKDDWLGFSCFGYESGIELKGVKVKAVKGKLNTYAIHSIIKDLKTMTEPELIDAMEW